MSHKVVFVCLLVAGLGGCSKKTHPVQGQVVFENNAPAKELAGYLITLEIKDQNASATGTIKADGTFTVGTFQDGDGAPVGTHRVALTSLPPQIDEPRKPPLIGKKYASFDTSGLTVDVAPRDNNVTLKVERSK